MKEELLGVKEFMYLAGQEIPHEPSIGSDALRCFRVDLINEEMAEYYGATSLIEIADAIGDMLYVVLGAAVAHGIDIKPIFDEIHRSNMTKFIDGHKDKSGKWIKGPSYEPANLGPILEKQINGDA